MKKKPLDPQPELRSFERDGIESEIGTDETEKEETEIWKRWKRTEIILYFSEYFHFLSS